MPYLEIGMPRMARPRKERLAMALTEDFSSLTGHEAAIFGIRFFEYGPGETAGGGKLHAGGSGKPYLHFLLYCPRLKRSAKQKLVAAFTASFARCAGKPDWRPAIHICEHPYDNVGVEGKLLSDAYEECAKQKFYYDLPQD